MLLIHTINSPSDGTMRILSRKIQYSRMKEELERGNVNSVGLIQGQLSEIIVAGDIAQKASNVEIVEITGMCPQHVSMIAVFGDTSSVLEALNAVHTWEIAENHDALQA